MMQACAAADAGLAVINGKLIERPVPRDTYDIDASAAHRGNQP
ncbi:MAG: hypothetical protein QNJ85_09905 [Gammaproteobacteria bacterium]|nr:hypothetical protein [Gammaproteobacteria bacterium]